MLLFGRFQRTELLQGFRYHFRNEKGTQPVAMLQWL